MGRYTGRFGRDPQQNNRVIYQVKDPEGYEIGSNRIDDEPVDESQDYANYNTAAPEEDPLHREYQNTVNKLHAHHRRVLGGNKNEQDYMDIDTGMVGPTGEPKSLRRVKSVSGSGHQRENDLTNIAPIKGKPLVRKAGKAPQDEGWEASSNALHGNTGNMTGAQLDEYYNTQLAMYRANDEYNRIHGVTGGMNQAPPQDEVQAPPPPARRPRGGMVRPHFSPEGEIVRQSIPDNAKTPRPESKSLVDQKFLYKYLHLQVRHIKMLGEMLKDMVGEIGEKAVDPTVYNEGLNAAIGRPRIWEDGNGAHTRYSHSIDKMDGKIIDDNLPIDEIDYDDTQDAVLGEIDRRYEE